MQEQQGYTPNRQYRGKCIMPGELEGKFVYGDRIHSDGKTYIHPTVQRIHFSEGGHLGKLVIMHEVDPKTVGQYTGLKDKNENEICEGDVLRCRRPARNQQTHYGENIPFGGSYTEPLEPFVEEELVEVIFADGGFGFEQTSDHPRYIMDVVPLKWIFDDTVAADEDDLKILFSGHWGDRILDGWEDDLECLLETYNLADLNELMKYIGVEIIGNIHDNPELLEVQK